MKKILVALIVMLLLGGAGAGYYFFFMQKDEPEAPKATQVEQSSLQKETSKPILDLEAAPRKLPSTTLLSVVSMFTTSLTLML